MLPRDLQSTMSLAEAWCRQEMRRLYRIVRVRPMSQDEMRGFEFAKLGSELMDHSNTVDVTVTDFADIDASTGAGEWEARFSCLKCGSQHLDWPAPHEMTRMLAEIGLATPTGDPILATAMCGQCGTPLGVATALRGMAAWLATWAARKAGGGL